MRTLIIAEAGINHNGNIEIAKQLIEKAINSGADFIKFQTFISELNISTNALKAEYQIENTKNKDESQLEMVKKLELKFEDFEILNKICMDKKIYFLSTGFDFPSIDFLDKLNIPFFKIPSGEITNKPYLKHIANKGKPVIMSTGMANMNEIKAAIQILMGEELKKEQITILHCNTEYPTPMEDVNLRAMLTIQKELGVKIGYSDHTQGIEVPIAAVALGATVIEKHFTLDKNMEGPDHKASLEPDELTAMVKAIRNIEKAMGDGIKKPSDSEKKNIPIARKSIVAAKNILKGEKFTEENITTKRPGTGISPMKWNEVLAKTAQKDFGTDDLIEIK